jgi:uncharacterized protein YndB with AHSA1/START domain
MIPPTSQDDNTTLVLRRTFAASRERVFRAWTTPAALERWLKPRSLNIIVRALDVRVGGSFCFEIADGNRIVGTYLQVVPPERLAFTWSGTIAQSQETVVTLDFFERGAETTEVVLTHEGLVAPDQRTRVESGWSSFFDALAVVLASSDLAL